MGHKNKVIVLVLVIIIIGGSLLWWRNKDKTLCAPGNKTCGQNDELVESKFKLAIRNFWGVREVFRNPQSLNEFYYTTVDGSGANIWMYDLNKDSSYPQNGQFNIPEGNTLVFGQKLAQYREFRGVGFSGNKFVFVETDSDDSPGPCFSRWLYTTLEYIDVGMPGASRKTFTMPADMKKAEEQNFLNCQKAL